GCGSAHIVERLNLAAAGLLLPALCFGARFGDGYAVALGKRTQGFDEAQPLGFLDELDGIPRDVAAEAVIEAALFVDVKARSLFLVERAEPDVASAAARKFYRFTDELDDVGPLADAFDRVLTDHLRSLTAYSPLAKPGDQVTGIFLVPVLRPERKR